MAIHPHFIFTLVLYTTLTWFPHEFFPPATMASIVSWPYNLPPDRFLSHLQQYPWNWHFRGLPFSRPDQQMAFRIPISAMLDPSRAMDPG
jgi:hypothetical protein